MGSRIATVALEWDASLLGQQRTAVQRGTGNKQIKVRPICDGMTLASIHDLGDLNTKVVIGNNERPPCH